jgi:hypothetical protein
MKGAVMKCEDLWLWAETGNVLRRLSARRHAARCPRCRESLAKLNAIKHELATSEPPSLEQRRLWERCTASPVAFPAGRKHRALVAQGFALVAAVAVAVAVWSLATWHGAEPPRVPRGGPTLVERKTAPDGSRESLRRIDEMKSGLLAMSDELEELSRSASLLDERRQVDDLLSSCRPL